MAAPSRDGRAAEAGSPETRRVLAFTIGAREFGLLLDPIVEIIRYGGATPIPHPEAAIEGILPLRGRMVTLLDVRRFLNRPERSSGSLAQVIVVETSGDLLGLVVDVVTRVMTASAAPEPLETVEDLDRPGLFEGVVRSGDGEVVLLDLEAILAGIA
ncbi:MAG: hypothetical protein AUH92_00095 [Acidobacteria bacterium 13_1_40CM_4_69_4]|nr:MAG: hypothetical protein AUH92_00095 [Acidobacteria bacterium 13_1_40CM_4_69_4]